MLRGGFALFEGFERVSCDLGQRKAPLVLISVPVALGREADFADCCEVRSDYLVAEAFVETGAGFGLVARLDYSVCKYHTPPSLSFNAFRTAVIFKIFVAWSSFSRRSWLKNGLREFKKAVLALPD